MLPHCSPHLSSLVSSPAIVHRSLIDRTPDKVGAKIRLARLDRVPYMIVLGQKEVEDGTVSIRRRDSEELTTMSLEDFIAKVKSEITERSL